MGRLGDPGTPSSPVKSVAKRVSFFPRLCIYLQESPVGVYYTFQVLTMPPCPHFQWFELLGKDSEWSLVDPDRLRSIESLLPDPTRQNPILIFFVGKSRKAQTLKTMFTENNLSRRRSHRIANLFLDFASDQHDHPVLIADCTLNATSAHSFGPWHGCHENRRLDIDFGESPMGKGLDTVIANVHANLIVPLSHIVCLFSTDFGGNRACRDYVRRWIYQRPFPSNTWRVPAPELIVVTEDPSTIDTLVQLECEPEFSSVFDSLTIVTVDSAIPLNLTAPKLQRVLRGVAEEVQKSRQERNVFLSAHQMRRIVHYGAHAFTLNPKLGIDVLSSSNHPAAALNPSAMASHLASFLTHAERHNFPPSMVSGLIASALLKQGYPHFLHCTLWIPSAC